MLLGAPIVPVATAWVWRRRPLLLPALMIVAMTAAAAILAVTTGLFGDPAALAVTPPMLAAVIIVRMPAVRKRLAVVLPLLVARLDRRASPASRSAIPAEPSTSRIALKGQ